MAYKINHPIILQMAILGGRLQGLPPNPFCVRQYRPHQKQSKRCHEALFCEFPCSTIVFFINLLKTAEVYIQDTGVDNTESEERQEGFIFF